MMTRKLCVAALVVAFLSWSGSAFAYSTLYGCRSAWPSADLPVPYHVTEDMPDELPDIEQVRRIYRDSFAVWGEPCCSNFAASDQGTTTASGENNRDNLWTITILEDSWPSALGDANSTLGVTLTMVDGACWIIGSDVVFNAYKWTFVDGEPQTQSQADLVSIATHEFGHFLGLGHTNVFGATMYPAYTGGTELRNLHQDDIDGVCYLYEEACSCTNTSECVGDQECIDDVCQIPPCETHADCDSGLICNEWGDCVVPPCDNDDDCLSGYVCDPTGACVPNADCPICGECTANADCGVNGICIPAGYIGANSACTIWCNSSADCPGNTDCFTVPTGEGDVNLCFNSDAATAGPCPSDFVCQADGTDLCAGVTCDAGQVCNPSTGVCQGGSGDDCLVCETCSGTSTTECGVGGSCLAFVGGPTVCSEPCGADGSCPGNSTCFSLESEGGGVENWCLNSNAGSAGICGGGWVCETNPTNPCDGVTCEGDQYCNVETGLCEGGSTTEPDAGFPDVSNPDAGTSGVTPTGGGDNDSTVGCGCAASPARQHIGYIEILAILGGVVILRRRQGLARRY